MFKFKETVIKSFRKQALQEKFDFGLIYPSNDDAVREILKNQNQLHMIEAGSDNKVESFQNVRLNEGEDDSAVYPPNVYKNRRDSLEENDFYVERF